MAVQMTGPRARGRIAAVIGAGGFIGRHVVRRLARAGFRVKAGVRRPEQALFLKPMGETGQIELARADFADPDSLARLCAGAEVVVNAAGILYERGAQRFDLLHRRGPAQAARRAKEGGAACLIHLSALGAERSSAALYARSKAAGEEEVRRAFAQAHILRPSLVFGPEDDFFNRFAGLARLFPALPVIGGGTTRFQPVYVEDVAGAVLTAALGRAAPGIYELGGPQIYTFRALMAFIVETIGRRRLLAPVPVFAARALALFAQYMPKPLLTPDQLRLLAQDSVVSAAAARRGRDLAGLGVAAPASIEAIVPAYLSRFRPGGAGP